MKTLGSNGAHSGMLLVCSLVMAGAVLVFVSGFSLANLAPLALLVVCPLMHFLMMRGHGSHSQASQPSCHEPKAAPAPATSKDG